MCIKLDKTTQAQMHCSGVTASSSSVWLCVQDEIQIAINNDICQILLVLFCKNRVVFGERQEHHGAEQKKDQSLNEMIDFV